MDQARLLVAGGERVWLFLGFDGCPWCEQALPYIRARLAELQTAGTPIRLYYVDVKPDSEDLRTDSNEAYTYLLSLTDSERIYVPYLAVYENGELLDSHTGTVDDHHAAEDRMTQEQEAGFVQVVERILSANFHGEKKNAG